MRAIYNGHEALTFGDYLDAETGKTLHAEPGGVYDITPASGRVVADVPVPWFTVFYTRPESSSWEEAAPEAALEPAADEEPAEDAAGETPAGEVPDGDPGEQEPQQF